MQFSTFRFTLGIRGRIYVCHLLQLVMLLVLFSTLATKDHRLGIYGNEDVVNDKRLMQLHSQKQSPRVVFIVVQTRRSEGWCKMLLSSILSNVSVVSIGFGNQYRHTDRPFWLLNYINEHDMKDDDMFVVFDGGDTFFTGPLRIRQAVEHFMATTAPTEDAFNATAVHRGEATSPLLFASEPGCYAPQMYLIVRSGPQDSKERCALYYKRMADIVRSMPNQRILPEKTKRIGYLNGGGMVGRVWAFRKAFGFFAKVLGMNNKWWCDQSIWALLYVWSLAQYPTVAEDLRLPYGLVNLDHNHRFFFEPFTGVVGSPAILHTPGDPWDWKGRLPNILNHTLWYREMKHSPKMLEDTRRLLETTAHVEVTRYNGETLIRPFWSVCSTKKVTNLDWLASTTQRK